MRAFTHIAKENPGSWHATGAEGLLGSWMNNHDIQYLDGTLQAAS